MKNEIRLLSFFICLVALVMFFSGCGQKTKAPMVQNQPTQNYETIEQEEEQKIGRPWVEVLADGVYILSDDSEEQPLITGDEIMEGETIETDNTGMANLYFPDGSVARMDSNTKIQILTGEYDYDSKTLKVKISLIAGNLWSKIIKLVTPESAWEVTTSNAVAAVRGSAFGASATREATTIIGSEHNIAVVPIDRSKGSLIANQEVMVGEKQMIVITSDDLTGFISGKKRINDLLRSADSTVYKPRWIAASLLADDIIRKRLLELQSHGLSEDAVRQTYSDEIIKRFNPRIRRIINNIISEPRILNEAVIRENQNNVQEPEQKLDNNTEQNASVEDSLENSEVSEQTEPIVEEVDESWSNIPISTDTNPNLGQYFIDSTNVN